MAGVALDTSSLTFETDELGVGDYKIEVIMMQEGVDEWRRRDPIQLLPPAVRQGNVHVAVQALAGALHFSVADQEQPEMMVIDSIQVMHHEGVDSAPGGVAQVRECAAYLTRYAKAPIRYHRHRCRLRQDHFLQPHIECMRVLVRR